MTRWERFKHAFVQCRGDVLRREYLPPRPGKWEFNGLDSERLLNEALYGVTLLHIRCAKCGRRFTNRHLGDWREGS